MSPTVRNRLKSFILWFVVI